ncbi:MAG: flagellar motor switch protein FliN [Desulfobacterales bacterium]|nr:flagellar motor switch protein FliN [Desulfobacterales bacterium]MDJ0913990.1 flagellar motor switch protein FliN [Desulfobacterales bacterium]
MEETAKVETPENEIPNQEAEVKANPSAAPAQETQDREIDFILDIPLELSVELGRTRMLVNDLLQLGQGSVVELDKLAGEPLEIYINRKLVARGEVVVVNEKFGIRLTDIVSPIERVKSLH